VEQIPARERTLDGCSEAREVLLAQTDSRDVRKSAHDREREDVIVVHRHRRTVERALDRLAIDDDDLAAEVVDAPKPEVPDRARYGVAQARLVGAGEVARRSRRTASQRRRARETESSRLERTDARRSRRQSELQREERRARLLRVRTFGDGHERRPPGCRDGPAENRGTRGAVLALNKSARRSCSVPASASPRMRRKPSRTAKSKPIISAEGAR
jgi:hypothetical protein